MKNVSLKACHEVADLCAISVLLFLLASLPVFYCAMIIVHIIFSCFITLETEYIFLLFTLWLQCFGSIENHVFGGQT